MTRREVCATNQLGDIFLVIKRSQEKKRKEKRLSLTHSQVTTTTNHIIMHTLNIRVFRGGGGRAKCTKNASKQNGKI